MLIDLLKSMTQRRGSWVCCRPSPSHSLLSAGRACAQEALRLLPLLVPHLGQTGNRQSLASPEDNATCWQDFQGLSGLASDARGVGGGGG